MSGTNLRSYRICRFFGIHYSWQFDLEIILNLSLKIFGEGARPNPHSHRRIANCGIADCEILGTRERAKFRISAIRNLHFFLLPTANRLSAERTYITPSDNAGVAIKSSPIVFVAMWENF